MRAATISPRALGAGPLRSKRLLALAGDERLVEQIRRGNDLAFEVAFERHVPAILGFCRHMLGSVEEAEDATQQTFASAHGALQRDGEREIALKPWLFTIARNRCLSMLRTRREQPVDRVELTTAGLAEEVEQRAELRRLLADVHELPAEQRAALLLAELGALSQAEVAHVLDCEVARVKALVFRARSRLIERRAARETPCEQIQEQLANLRGGSLRRTELRLHLRECPGCRLYREQVREQRRLLAAALPVAPTLGLKGSVLAALGIGGGSAGGGAAAAGLASGAGAFGSALGSGTLAKVALVGVLAGGGAVATDAVIERGAGSPEAPAAVAPASPRAPATETTGPTAPVSGTRRARHDGPAPGAGTERSGGARTGAGAVERAAGSPGSAGERGRSHGPETEARHVPRQPGHQGKGAGEGPEHAAERAAGHGRGRGPIEAPPADTPVKRGPPASVPNPPRPRPSPAPRARLKAPVAPVPEAPAPDPAGTTPKGQGKAKP